MNKEREALQKAQEVLQRHILPDSKLTDAEAISDLYGILDNKELFIAQQALKEPTEPNQTEAEKGSLRKIATEIMDKEYSFFTPDTRKKMGYEPTEEVSQGEYDNIQAGNGDTKQSPSVEEIAEDIISKLLWGRQGLNSYELYLRDVTIKAMIEMRKQVIEEIEEWVKEEWFGAKEDDMTYHEHVVNADELLIKLKTLTP